MPRQLAFYFDADICTGCRACVLACKDKNDNPVGINFRKVHTYSGGNWIRRDGYADMWVPSNLFAYSVSVACMHCQEPVCVEVCPSGAAFKRDDGIVDIDKTKCLGCRLCEQSCPYGALSYNAELGVMTKCDLCHDLLDRGEQPACVAICPMRALQIGELEELQREHGTEDAIEPLPPSHLTKPSIVIKPHRHARATGQGSGRVRTEV